MAFITNITTTPVTGSYGDNGLPLYVDNRHGNIRDGGTIADSTNWSSSALGEGNPVITIVSGVGPVEGAVPGTFNQGTQTIMIASTTIAGNSSTVMEGGDSNSANVAYTPLQLDVLRTYFYKTAVRQGNWNIFTGAFSSINNAVSGAYNITTAVDDAAGMRAAQTDVAANPTQDTPGRLVFRDGNPLPVQSGYHARYNW
jgi:hypothetical protein